MAQSNPTTPKAGIKLTFEEIKAVVGDIVPDWSSSNSSLKRQRVEEPGNQSAAPSSPAKEQSSVAESEGKRSLDFCT
mgnify:CR=1 FL=1